MNFEQEMQRRFGTGWRERITRERQHESKQAVRAIFWLALIGGMGLVARALTVALKGGL